MDLIQQADLRAARYGEVGYFGTGSSTR
eukprot:SAG31_NODE_2893_length_4940_cov_237.861805_1_plen_27_part_10